MGKLLIHVCCAHCGAYTVDFWRAQGRDVTLLWYNPNIHPFTEHQHRLDAFKGMAEVKAANAIIDPGYDIGEYFRAVCGHKDERCSYCFALRLGRTAAVARILGLDSITTTLLISPHQKHEIIRKQGESAAQQQGIIFDYADLRKRYSDSRRQTKAMNLYRQQYCGCLYSAWERYRR